MYDWFINCRKFTERASRALDERAGPVHWLLLRIRRRVCKNSNACWHQMLTLRRVCRDFDGDCGFEENGRGLPAEAGARIKRALAAESRRMAERKAPDGSAGSRV